MEEYLFQVIPSVVFIILFVSIVLLSYYSNKRRREDMKKLANSIGFNYTKEKKDICTKKQTFSMLKKNGPKSLNELDKKYKNNDEYEWYKKFEKIKTFEKYGVKKYKNCISGKYNSKNWEVFDYSITTSSGRKSNTKTFTVLYINTEYKLPSFVLTKENFFDKVKEFFGANEINFESHPNFSKKYALYGDSEKEIRKLFDSNILNLFERLNLSKFSIEAKEKNLFIILKRQKVKKIRSLMDKYYEIARAFDKKQYNNEY